VFIAGIVIPQSGAIVLQEPIEQDAEILFDRSPEDKNLFTQLLTA
jgi:hypothetical protein